jgi:2-oxoglutarate ferredoxin oxidoreductase subunit delta
MSNIIRSKAKDKDIVIIIDRNLCKGCNICVEVCTPGTLELVDAPDKWEGSVVQVKDVELCNFCRLCEIQCPDFAIRVVRSADEEGLTMAGGKKTSAE